MAGLLDRRLIFVTGKGGVGKSTVATAIGLLGARAGRRTIIVELAGQEQVQRAFEHAGEHFRELELAPGLFTISIDPQQAMEEYLRIKTGPLGHTLSSSRLFHAFAMATPGMREMLSMGKIWELAQPQRRTRDAASYDLVVVDAPASGHGVAILQTPKTFAEIARVGPIAHQGRTVAATIADRAFTAVVAVAIPEEMPVNETLSLRDALSHQGLALEAVVLNALYPARFGVEQGVELERALTETSAPASRAAIRAALSSRARAASQRAQKARLGQGLGITAIELPFLFVDRLGRAELTLLADALQAGLDRRRARRPR